MSYPCFLTTGDSADAERPGAMWFGVGFDGATVWMVTLPGGAIFSQDNIAIDGTHWQISGSPPNVTVHPSINVMAPEHMRYHGWLRDGVLSDDLEGRTYESEQPS